MAAINQATNASRSTATTSRPVKGVTHAHVIQMVRSAKRRLRARYASMCLKLSFMHNSRCAQLSSLTMSGRSLSWSSARASQLSFCTSCDSSMSKSLLSKARDGLVQCRKPNMAKTIGGANSSIETDTVTGTCDEVLSTRGLLPPS